MLSIQLNSLNASLDKQLENIIKANSDISKLHIKFPEILKEEDLELFKKYIQDNKNLPFARLSFTVNLSTLKNNKFQALLENLNLLKDLKGVQLQFEDNEVKSSEPELIKSLTNDIAPIANYPIYVSPKLKLETFETRIIANIQKRYQEHRLIHADLQPKNYGTQDRLGKPIKLKQLVNESLSAKTELTNLEQYVPVEVQHVEVTQQVVQQEIAQQQNINVQAEIRAEMQQISTYQGQLLGFTEFATEDNKKKTTQRTQNTGHTELLYKTLSNELFANLPHAIKFVSPEAATELAQNLPNLVTMNRDNLPNGFLLKQTLNGELVLDYHPRITNSVNQFTPKINEIESEKIYSLDFEKLNLSQLLNDDILFKWLHPDQNTYHEHLTNLWIKYGDKGVSSFAQNINTATQANTELKSFLLNHYLKFIPQWDHLHENHEFFNAVKRISAYDEQKLSCFKRFIENSGPSQHDLINTTKAFESFWTQLALSCNEHKISIAKINEANWTTPVGDPAVFMERIQFILNNARDFGEQLQLLGGKTLIELEWRSEKRIRPAGLCLTNYGAYYAARYEGFNTVASCMDLTYNAEQQNTLAFNQNYYLYRPELKDLVDHYLLKERYNSYGEGFDLYIKQGLEEKAPHILFDSNKSLPLPPVTPETIAKLKEDQTILPFSNKKFVPPYQAYFFNKDKQTLKLQFKNRPTVINNEWFYAPCARYLGIQNSGIKVDAFINNFEPYTRSWQLKDISGILLANLFFVTHNRYIENDSRQDFYWGLERTAEGLKSVKKLYTTSDSYELIKKIEWLYCHRHVLNGTVELLYRLYKADTRLNQTEGLRIIESIAGMNSSEFEHGPLKNKKSESILKLLKSLAENKFGTLKFLNFHAAYPKLPYLYTLDTAEFLARDPQLTTVYRDDLLLFCGMLNWNSSESYYHGLETAAPEKFKIVHANLLMVQKYLKLAASGTKDKPNNFQYAVQIILNSKEYISYSQFLAACKDIEQLNVYEEKSVDDILEKYKIVKQYKLPSTLLKDDKDLRNIMVLLAAELERAQVQSQQQPPKPPITLIQAQQQYQDLSHDQLQKKLEQLLSTFGNQLNSVIQTLLQQTIAAARDVVISKAFKGNSELLSVLAKKILQLPDFNHPKDFDKVNLIATQANSLASLIRVISEHVYVKEHLKELTEVLEHKDLDFSNIEYESLFGVFHLLSHMPQRNYLSLVKTLFSNVEFLKHKEQVLELLGLLTELHNRSFSTEYLTAFSRLVIQNPGQKDYKQIMELISSTYAIDVDDPLLRMALSDPKITYQQVKLILGLTHEVKTNRDKLHKLVSHLLEKKCAEQVIQEITNADVQKQPIILELISKSFSLKRSNDKELDPADYQEAAKALANLPISQLQTLQTFFAATPVSINCFCNLIAKLKDKNEHADLQHILKDSEKEPFGERDLEEQYSVSEVERVINTLKDRLTGSSYPYQYRKQLMEAFLFVNAIGKDLPVYRGKAAKDLSNDEIRELYTLLKNNPVTDVTPFEKRLLAAGLIREAIYRSTGEFPNSTQIIDEIQVMMHEGDVISGIPTGAGKTLGDISKACILYLDSDRVDITTSSLPDAKRYIENYGSVFYFLGIPYTKKPIASTSSFDEFQTKGINLSTSSQLSLFSSKAKVAGIELETAKTVVSLVANEIDRDLLDNLVVNRLAVPDDGSIRMGEEWIWQGINEFVTQPGYIKNKSSMAGEEIRELREYLKGKAQKLHKSDRSVNRFTEKQYYTWLESAILVNYVLKKDVDYVIPDEFEKRMVNGRETKTKVVKVLLKDWSVSPDSTFGNGIQQLLYARLNNELNQETFVIEQPTKTVLSTNIKNRFDFYRAQKGFIWGSTATPGSNQEVQQIFAKYGFESKETESHYKSKVVFDAPIFADNEEAQLARLFELLSAENNKPETERSSHIVFCKDINTAKRFFDKFKQKHTQNKTHLYTGLESVENTIKNATQYNTVTFTTSALGRNADFVSKNLKLWHTSPDSERNTKQKSGRTGRGKEGGQVGYIYNKQELNNKTIEQIQAETEERATKERTLNEVLFNVLGVFQTYIDKLPPNALNQEKRVFLRDKWSLFSEEIEILYREIAFDENTFVQQAISKFNELVASSVKSKVEIMTVEDLKRIIHQKQQRDEKYTGSTIEALIKDCTTPAAISWHLLGKTPNASINKGSKKDEIKQKLEETFKKLSSNISVMSLNHDYIRYLSQTPATQQIIVEAHKEFLNEYLQKNSAKLSFWQRWFGKNSGPLTRMTNNSGFLLMFYGLTVNSQPYSVVSLETIKQSVTTLLDEYLDTCWFISSERKQWARELKEAIGDIHHLDDLFKCLGEKQALIAQKDIETQKNRWFTPLHKKGESRLQDVITKSISLTAALAGTTDISKHTEKLASVLREKRPLSEVPSTEIRQKIRENVDELNARVISKAIESNVEIQMREKPKGMSGRKNRFFEESEKRKPESDEASPDSKPEL